MSRFLTRPEGTGFDLSPCGAHGALFMSSKSCLVRSVRRLAVVFCALASLLGAPARADAQPLFATVTYPANGAVNADVSQPIQWTSVAGAQAYYLYVGTTLGAMDLVNTGEIQQTSYQPASLPVGPTLYVRLWTRVAGVWRSVDSTFTAAAAAAVLTATITYPVNAATNADMSNPIRWTSVANVQAYYLFVGTTVGTSNLVNSGETQNTSFSAPTLPLGQTLFARLWTKKNGVWRYLSDLSFTTGP